MQKVITVKDGNLEELNKELEVGFKIKSHFLDSYMPYIYFILERN